MIDNTNKTYVEYKTNQVGHYRITLQVKETFGQPTLSQYITAADYQSDITVPG
jgi:hypothetical protein